MEKLLTKIQNAKVLTAPYPHILIEDFLPPDLLKKVKATLFTSSDIVGEQERLETDISNDYSASKMPALDELNEFLSGAEFKKAILGKYKPFLASNLPYLNEDKASVSGTIDVLVRRFETNAACHKIRTPHVDDGGAVFNFLIYLRRENDPSTGGSFKMYSFKMGFRGFQYFVKDVHSVPYADIDLSKEIAFEDNKFLTILNGMNSVHDVSPLFGSSAARTTISGTLEFPGERLYRPSDYIRPRLFYNVFRKVSLLMNVLR